MGRLGVLVVGTGMVVSKHHIPALKNIEEIELVGIVSRSEKRAKFMASQYGFKKYFTDLDKALSDKDVDAVLIGTPTYEHKVHVLKALEYDKHVIVEKPIALKISDGYEMYNVARKKSLKFMVAHVVRFWPGYVEINRLVKNGVLGEPIIGRSYRYSEYPSWSYKLWHKYIDKSGGVMIDLAIHDIDYLRWVIGEVKSVYARGSINIFKDATAYDYTHIILEFKNNAIAFIDASWIMPKKFPFSTYIEIVGRKGIASFDNFSNPSLTLYKSDKIFSETPVSQDGYYRELRHFVDCIIKDLDPLVNGLEAVKSLEVALAAIKSIREKKVVNLPLNEEVI
ncbi:MAG TPA: Gfo/Idh/MocA family oxidoreductase [Thermoprotei archaeon]|nr:Gfo/Idh/MocA family oxidoreductase [Thermoprotei archaeon]